MNTTPAGNRHAFTLIELLVVIAIIAILAALLMPALRSVQQSIDRTKALSNLRVIGAGLQLYVGDHDNTIPGIYITNGIGQFCWPQLLAYDRYIPDTIAGRNASNTLVAGSSLVQLYDPLTRPLNPTVANAGGFGLNGFYTMASLPEGAGMRTTQLTRLAETVLAADADYHDLWWDYAIIDAPGNQLMPSTQVLGGANYLFCDYHVAWLQAKDPTQPNSPPVGYLQNVFFTPAQAAATPAPN